MSWELTETELMIADCMSRESKMNEWERGFIQSLEEGSKSLSPKQLEQLEKIWERIT